MKPRYIIYQRSLLTYFRPYNQRALNEVFSLFTNHNVRASRMNILFHGQIVATTVYHQ